MTDKIISALSDIPNLVISENELMSKHTTFKIGGPAKLFFDARTRVAATEALMRLSDIGVSPYILGNGSNTLFPDNAYETPVLKLSCSDISMSGETLAADAGVLLPVLSSFAMKNSLTGLEFAHGIPGSLGGAVTMNAGAYDGEMRQVIRTVRAMNQEGCVVELSGDQCAFEYRHSLFSGGSLLVLSAEMELKHGDEAVIRARMAELMEKRREKQPLEWPSAGSTFKRPPGHYAGKLIQDAGLQGYTVGGAQVSEKHAGFIINIGGATASDDLGLVEHIKGVIRANYGVELECEIRRVGNGE